MPGDMAVTSSGVHVLAYLGERTWIEADPNELQGNRVIRVKTPTRNAWFNMPVHIMRWRQFDTNESESSVSASSVQTKVFAPEVASHSKPTPTPNLTSVKLPSSFRFVIKELEMRRETNDQTGNEAIFFSAKLAREGTKPPWWGVFPDLYSLTYTTNTGKRYQGRDVEQGEDYFLDTGDGLYILYSQSDVPKLSRKERVVKVEAEFLIGNEGLAKITTSVPRQSQQQH